MDPEARKRAFPLEGGERSAKATFGRFFEVTLEGELVGEYVNPYFGE
jgi:hypothetical protein